MGAQIGNSSGDSTPNNKLSMISNHFNGSVAITMGTNTFKAKNGNYYSTNNTFDQSYGATGSRPISPLTGVRFFDTTLGLPIWFNGTNWVDASGTIV